MSSGIDVLIRGAKVVDGSGNPWFYGDVALCRRAHRRHRAARQHPGFGGR